MVVVFLDLHPVPPPLPPRRLKKPRPTSLPLPPLPSAQPPHGPPSLPPPVPPRGEYRSAPSVFSLFPPSFLFTISPVNKQKGGITPQANINVVSLNIGQLVDISQGQRTRTHTLSCSLSLCHFLKALFYSTFPRLPPAAGLENVQTPVVCEKCSAALSYVSLVKRNVSSN